MNQLLTCAIVALLGLSLTAFAVDRTEPEVAAAGKGALYHVVSLKFKDSASKEQIKEVETAFRELKGKIPGITSLKWGTNVSPEKHDKGFTHCFVLTFATEKDRDAYLPHDAHKAFGKKLGPVMADVMVIDFWAQD
jgi:hypothetical protein